MPTGTKDKGICIRCPILNYEYAVYVLVGGTREQAGKQMRKWLEDPTLPGEAFEECRGRCFVRQGYHPHIYVALKPNEEHFWATLAHEACHAVSNIFLRIGETHFAGEIYAHSVASIVSTVELVLEQELNKEKKRN